MKSSDGNISVWCNCAQCALYKLHDVNQKQIQS